MKMLHTLAASVVLISSITTAAQAGTPDDPPGFSQDFDFFDAWGVHPIKESGMALLPDESGLPPKEGGLHQFYDVGVSFVESDKSPSFEAYGTIEGLELWWLPGENTYGQFDLADFGGADRAVDFQGTAEYVDLLFLGRLSTPTGYNEIITGILHVSRFDFESPEEMTIGTMLLFTESEWLSSDDARAYINETVSIMSPFIAMDADPDDGETEGARKRRKCWRQYWVNKDWCIRTLQSCVDTAWADHDACIENVGFEDAMDAAGTDATIYGASGALIGGGIGWFTPLTAVTAAGGATVGGIGGAVVGVCTGIYRGQARARRECRETLDSQLRQCRANYDLCKVNAYMKYMRCIESIEE